MSVLRKIGRILLLIGGIFALLSAVSSFFMIVLGGVLAVAAPAIYSNLPAEIQAKLPEGGQSILVIIGVVIAVLSLFFAVFSLVCGILGIKGFKQHDKKLYIENIVFSVLALELLPLVGAILGLIALAKEKKAMPQPEEAPKAE